MKISIKRLQNSLVCINLIIYLIYSRIFTYFHIIVKSKEQVIKEDKNQLEEIKEFGKDDNKDTKNNPIEKNTNANQK